jgi:hypothetical protein
LQMIITFLSSLTTVIMEPLLPWERWTMVLKSICLN